ncbi:MAG: hypothetical protein ACLFR8_08250 [Alkalispirochaeta sp.]
MSRRIREVLALAGMIAIQIGLLRISSPIVAAAALALLWLVAGIRGLPLRRTLPAMRGVLVLLVPVLLFRFLSLGFSPTTFFPWAAYTIRLVAAVIAAQLLLHEIGPTGVRRGLAFFLRPLPRIVAEPTEAIAASALYLIPGVLARISAVRGAARVRFGGGERGDRGRGALIRRHAGIYRAVLLGLFSIPQGRAEAMVVRGVQAPSEPRGTDGRRNRSDGDRQR